METIRIYHSMWRMLLLVLASLTFAVAGFFMTIHSPRGFHIVVGWVSVAFQTTNIEQQCDPNLSSQRTGHAAGLLRCKGRSNMRSPLTNEWQEGFTMLI